MSKFIRIGVSRKSWTDLYVEVEDSFDMTGVSGFASARKLPLANIANDTTSKHDWETDSILSNRDLEVEEVQVVHEKEAKQFVYWSEVEHKITYERPKRTY